LIRGIAVPQKNGRKWLGLPSRQYQTDSGSLTWIPVIELPNRERRAQFDGLVLSALEEFIGARR
jgi:hypothetical protein